MARIDWVEARLLEWARAVLMAGSGCMGYSRVNLTDPTAAQDGYREAAIPTSDVQAADTEAAITRLAPELGDAVRCWYLRKGGKAQAAACAGCAESTLMARIDMAHRKLAEHWTERRRLADEERRRVEALQRTAARGFTT